MKDKKPLAGIIMASLGKKEPMDGEGEDMNAKMEIAKDILHAIKVGDANMLSDALSAHFQASEEEPHMEGSNEEME